MWTCRIEYVNICTFTPYMYILVCTCICNYWYVHVSGRTYSHATGTIFLYNIFMYIYQTDRVHTYRIVLRISILAYTQQFQWCLMHLAVFVTVNSRVPCLLMPPISVIVNFDNTSSTTHHLLCLNRINSYSVSWAAGDDTWYSGHSNWNFT